MLMKNSFVIIVLFTLFIFPAFGYTSQQLKSCELGVKQSPIFLGTPNLSVEEFCNCSLESIVNNGNDPKVSINKCASIHFK